MTETGDLVLRAALSFILAGTWIGGATLLGERLGSRLGGLVVNLPSNIVLSLLFIALTKGTPFAVEAAGASVIGMAVNTLFIFAFVLVLPPGIAAAVAVSLATWFLFAVLLAFLKAENAVLSLLVYAAVCIGGFLYLEYGLGIAAVPKKKLPFNPRSLLLRAFFAGSVVASAVLVAQVAPAHVTGIATTFPAVMLSTLTILARTQGPAFTRATGKILLLTSSNIIVYTFAVSRLYPVLGLLGGTFLAFLGAVVWILLFLPLTGRLK